MLHATVSRESSVTEVVLHKERSDMYQQRAEVHSESSTEIVNIYIQ